VNPWESLFANQHFFLGLPRFGGAIAMDGLILAGVVLIGVIWWLSRKRSLPKRLKRVRSPLGTSPVPGHLMQQLDRLTRDRRVSERLIENIAFNNPGKSKRWCVEKAIYDIQRDRRS
jgi:hypothetical protein